MVTSAVLVLATIVELVVLGIIVLSSLLFVERRKQVHDVVGDVNKSKKKDAYGQLGRKQRLSPSVLCNLRRAKPHGPAASRLSKWKQNLPP